MLEMITCNVAALMIAVIYYAWRDKLVKVTHRRKVLRERVAYLLWSVAQRA